MHLSTGFSNANMKDCIHVGQCFHLLGSRRVKNFFLISTQ